jgi:hypothetical protein
LGNQDSDQERICSNAKKQIETEIEIEDPPRRQEALQVYGQWQNQTGAFRQAPLDGHQSARPYAQVEEADARKQG